MQSRKLKIPCPSIYHSFLLLTPWQLAATCNNILARQLLTVGDGSTKGTLQIFIHLKLFKLIIACFADK